MILKIAIRFVVAMAIATGTQALAQEPIKVGITTTGIPFTFVDIKTEKPSGAMVDLASAIAADMGTRTDFQISAFPALIPALTSGKINLISAAMFITDKRKKVIDFSTPVYTYGEAMFVAADDSRDYKIQDLKDQAVGAPIGSTIADDLISQGIFGDVKLYDSIADIVRDVRLGRIKAGFADRPIVAYQIENNSNLGIRLVQGYQPMHKGVVALAVAKDNKQLLDGVNASIAKFEANGELARIFAKYGL